MKRIMASFFCVVWLAVSLSPAVQAEDGDKEQLTADLHALSAVLMDAHSGRVLVDKDGQTMRPMASTTKILTCILALEEADPDDTVTASANAAAQPSVHLGMREGEQYRLGDLLYGLMLESYNDTAVAIAEHMAGSVEAFAVKMNEKAAQIGCTAAHFVTPNGLDGQDEGGVHSISAADLARIMSYCVCGSPAAGEFLALTQTPSYAFSTLDGSRNFSCTNHNAFLQMMEGAISGKTGFTGDAGYCYVGALESEERTFVVALLGCGWPNNKDYKWADTRALMEYGMAHYHWRDVWEEPHLPTLTVTDGISPLGLFAQAETPLVAEEPDRLQILMGEDEEVHVETRIPENLRAPVEAGETVGEIRYYLENLQLGTFQIRTAQTVERQNYGWMLGKVIQMCIQNDICIRR